MTIKLKDERTHVSGDSSWAVIWSGFKNDNSISLGVYDKLGGDSLRPATITLNADEALQIASQLINAARRVQG